MAGEVAAGFACGSTRPTKLLQRGQPLAPAEPWVSMPNTGTW